MRPSCWLGVSGVPSYGAVLVLDPGFHTGWSRWLNGVLIGQGVIEGGLDGFIAWANSHATGCEVLVIEDFIAQPDFVGRVWASEVKGAAIALIPHDRLVIQKRSDKSSLFGQKFKGEKGETERFNWLRARGFAGISHELDAITHGLVFYKREEHPAVWPRIWRNQKSPGEPGLIQR